MGRPRQTTVTCCPASSRVKSTVTGEPIARAFALGRNEAAKGYIADPAPTRPVVTVAATRKWRRVLSSFISSPRDSGVLVSARR